MTVAPIIERELQILAKAKWTFWARFGVGVVGATICVAQFLAASPGLNPAATGSFAFKALAAAAALFGAGACLVSADLLSGEQRAGTLKLLFLTRVTRQDLVLGKLASVGLTSACALATFLPVLMIPVLAGGVTGGGAFRTGLALANLLFLGLAAGLFGSSQGPDRARAVRLSSAVILILIAFPRLLSGFGWQALSLLSPVTTIQLAGDIRYSVSPASYVVSLALVHFSGWTLLGCAASGLRRSVLDEPAPVPPPVTRQEQGIWVLGRRWNPHIDNAKPIEWFVAGRQRVRFTIWSLAVISLAFNGWVPLWRAAAAAGVHVPGEILSWPIEMASGLFGAAIVLWIASRFFIESRRTGELEVLLTTPVGATSVVPDQVLLLGMLFPWPVLGLQVPVFLALVMQLEGLAGWVWFLLFALVLVNTWLGMRALCWFGLQAGALVSNQTIAVIRSLVLVKGVPFLISVSVWVLPVPGSPAFLLICVPLAITTLYYSALIVRSQKVLKKTGIMLEDRSRASVRGLAG